MNITREYFDDVLAAVDKLRGFTNSLAQDPEFCKVFDDVVKGSVNNGGVKLVTAEEKIPFIALADIVRVCSWLRITELIHQPEGLGLVLYSTKLYGYDDNCTYEKISRYSDIIVPSIRELVSAISESNRIGDDLLAFEYCLRAYSQPLRDQYVVLMYRLASLVAKADGTVTPFEAKQLNRIIKLISSESPEAESAGAIKSSSRVSMADVTPVSEAADELNKLIGLASVKEEITTLMNFIRIQKLREEQGLKIPPLSYHCVFTGNPGTGKTTVARIVSQIYKEIGVLKKGHLVETDRSGLCAEYVGQTAPKTNKIIDSALDGVLFIDEAYSLVSESGNDYGKEAIATLLKRMEDDRDRLVVILAGYTNEMRKFIDSNPGLQSRFNRYIEFPDYSAEELYQIFLFNAGKYEYKLSEEAHKVLREAMETAVTGKDKNFGNGRFVRNVFEKVIERQANRLASVGGVNGEILSVIEAEDITAGLEQHNHISF